MPGRCAALAFVGLLTGCFEAGGGSVTREAPSFRLEPGETVSLVLVSELVGPRYPASQNGGAGWTDLIVRGEAHGNAEEYDFNLVLSITPPDAATSSSDGPFVWEELFSGGQNGVEVWQYNAGAGFPSFGACEPAVPCVEETRLDLTWDNDDPAFEPIWEMSISAFVSSEWAPISGQSSGRLEVGWRAP